MRDRNNREINYLRISVTDRCNLRCVYCTDENAIDEIKHSEILTYEEIIRLVKIFVSIGIKNIKITGGEPLVRKDIINLIKNIKAIEGLDNLTITTNGVLLSEYIKQLHDVHVDGINISLDTLNKEHYKNITKRDNLDKVLLGVKEALTYKDIKIKINTVLFNHCSDEESKKNIIALSELAKNDNIDVRFIELMPISIAKNFKSKSEREVLDILKKEYGDYEVYNRVLGNGPARYYSFNNFIGKIGFISSVSHKFCNICNRVRITSFGYLKTCLDYEHGLDLKTLLRENSVSDEFIKASIIKTIEEKPIGHNFYAENRDNNTAMNKIGG